MAERFEKVFQYFEKYLLAQIFLRFISDLVSKVQKALVSGMLRAPQKNGFLHQRLANFFIVKSCTVNAVGFWGHTGSCTTILPQSSHNM